MFSKRDHANPMAETVREVIAQRRPMAIVVDGGSHHHAAPAVPIPASPIPPTTPHDAFAAAVRETESLPRTQGAEWAAEARTEAAKNIPDLIPDDLAQARAARDLLNRLAAEGKITMSAHDGVELVKLDGPLVLTRLVPRTVYDEEPL